MARLSTTTILAGLVWLTSVLVLLMTVSVSWLRPSYPGWRTWALGQTAAVLGLLITTLRQPDTLWLAVVSGNALIMLGALLLVQAFHRFAGLPWRRLPLASLALIVIVLLLGGLALVDQLLVRMLLVSGYLGGMTLILLRLMWTQWKTLPQLRSAYSFNLAVLLLATTLLWPRILLVASGSGDEAFALNLPNLAVYLAVLVYCLGGTLAFWMLHDDRRRAELEVLHTELRAQATLDPLTGLLNRRGLHTSWEQLMAEGPAMTLVALDLDGFKAVNDRHGHAAGDRVLMLVAQELRELTRPGEVAARMGGDEFVLLLCGMPEQNGPRLEQVILALQHRLIRQGLPTLGVSTGSVQARRADGLPSALHQADQSLYVVKHSRHQSVHRGASAEISPRASQG